MAIDILGPKGPNQTSARPPHSGSTSGIDTWFKDCDPSDPIGSPGTTITAQDLNFWVAQFREAIRGMGVTEDVNDDLMLLKAIIQAIRGIDNIGDQIPAYKGLAANGLTHELRTFLGINGIIVRLNGDKIEIDGSLLGGPGGGGGGEGDGWACTTFAYTGADQNYVVPVDASFVRVKAWGAGAYSGHPGGFAQAVFPAAGDFAPGAELKIVVGGHGGYHLVAPSGAWSINPPRAYGFGGDPQAPNGVGVSGQYSLGAGGGLSGVFTGTAAVLATDKARARVIAGGAGGIANQVFNASTSGGGNGGDPIFGGGMSTMQGVDFIGGGGGGGYEGGAQTNTRGQGYLAAGEGGTSFVHADAISSTLLATPDKTSSDVPNQTDPDYVSPVGHGGGSSGPDGNGMVIVCWS